MQGCQGGSTHAAGDAELTWAGPQVAEKREGQGGQKAQLENLLSCKTLLSFPIAAAIIIGQY